MIVIRDTLCLEKRRLEKNGAHCQLTPALGAWRAVLPSLENQLHTALSTALAAHHIFACQVAA